MNLDKIAVVHSPVTEGIDENWGNVVSEIHLLPELADGLRGLEDFSHVMVVFYLHKATFTPATDLVRRPQGRVDMPDCGIFAQRAKHRPNPIGVTAVELLSVDKNILTVRGLDAIDSTPVLDIKPYFPIYDSKGDAIVPEWVDRLMAGYF